MIEVRGRVVGAASARFPKRQLIPFRERTTTSQTIVLGWTENETGRVSQQSMSFDSATGESFVLGRGRAAPVEDRAQLSQHRTTTKYIIRYLYKEPEYTSAWWGQHTPYAFWTITPFKRRT